MTCDRCYGLLAHGEHGIGACAFQPRRTQVAMQGDDVPGGFTVTNAWREPRTFYSQREYEKALAADGMMLCPRYTPGSKHLSNWATVDPQTLENGRILAERQAQTKASDPGVDTSIGVTWTVKTTDTAFSWNSEAR